MYKFHHIDCRKTSDDMLSLFFESRKRSGGGDIEEITVDEDRTVAYITFASAEGMLKIFNNISSLVIQQ